MMNASPNTSLQEVQALAPSLAVFFEYPTSVPTLTKHHHPAITPHMQAHLDEWSAAPLSAQQESYTQTFDLSPRCTLLVSVHLFGPESFDRAQLMAGLAGEYARVKFGCGSELPDHLSVILKSAAALDTETWTDLIVYGVAPALPRMARLLDDPRAPSRWRHALRAAMALVEAVVAATGLTPPQTPPLGFAKNIKSNEGEGVIHA